MVDKATALPFSTTLWFGSNLPWERGSGLVRISCPDPDSSVVFEMRRQGAHG